MTTVYSIVNQKGGTGKTNTSIMLAHFLRHFHSRVLFIDANPNATATRYLYPKKIITHDLYDFITNDDLIINNFVVNSILDKVDLLPASNNLIGLEIELLYEKNREKVFFSKLKKTIPNYELVIIDTPSSLGLITQNALSMSDNAIISLISNNYNDTGLIRLIKTIKLIQNKFNPLLDIKGILIQMVGAPTNQNKEILVDLKTRFHNLIFESVIFLNEKDDLIADFSISNLLLDNRAVNSYKAFCEELMDKVSV